MKTPGYCLLLFSLAVCGSAIPGSAAAADAAVTEDSCATIENGMIPDQFGVDASLVSYRRSVPSKGAGHVLCTASWDNPDKAALDAAYSKRLQDWMRDKAAGKQEPMPKPPNSVAEVSVTLIATRFDSPAAAVSSLEDAVATLTEGVTVNVGGKDYTTQSSFGDWLDGVGDKAVFSEKGELLVAAEGRRFSVSVRVSEDADADRGQATALARRIIDTF